MCNGKQGSLYLLDFAYHYDHIFMRSYIGETHVIDPSPIPEKGMISTWVYIYIYEGVRFSIGYPLLLTCHFFLMEKQIILSSGN